MSKTYSEDKLVAAKQRYLEAIAEAHCSLLILDLLERAGGMLTGKQLAERLIEHDKSLTTTNVPDLLNDVGIKPDDYITLTDDLLEFGLGEVL